jgi:aminoglycoside phosphotransferase (APT) family kinase protein
LLDAGLDQEFPHLVLERLIGSDLGDVIATLPDGQLAHIARHVAKAQGLMAGTATAGRYGYAAIPEEAPHARWSGVLRASLDRSRCRIAAAGLFGTESADRLEALLVQHRVALDSLPATPFLHDTTTKNVIVTPEGAFSGIVDVDDLCFGDPRFAPALTLASLMVSGGPRRYVDAWLEAAGAADDAVFRLYVALFLVDFMSEHGQDFNGNQRPSVPAQRDRLTRLFADVAGGL